MLLLSKGTFGFIECLLLRRNFGFDVSFSGRDIAKEIVSILNLLLCLSLESQSLGNLGVNCIGGDTLGRQHLLYTPAWYTLILNEVEVLELRFLDHVVSASRKIGYTCLHRLQSEILANAVRFEQLIRLSTGC